MHTDLDRKNWKTRFRRTWEDNIKTDVIENEWDGVN